jgi:hypothetical protein
MSFDESKHPRGEAGKFSTSGGSRGTPKSKGGYAEREPLAFDKESPGTARYLIHNGMVRPYETPNLLDKPAGLLEYQVDIPGGHKGMTKTNGRIENHGEGSFKFVHDADKMQPVTYDMSGKPTPESVERQMGFDHAVKGGKVDWSKPENFLDGYRTGQDTVRDEPKEAVQSYKAMLKGKQSTDWRTDNTSDAEFSKGWDEEFKGRNRR